MAAAYGVSVLDPGLTPRRLWVLLNHLPPAFRRPGEHWSAEAELLAGLIDHVALLTWITLRANGDKATARPRPIARPPRRGGTARAALAAPRSTSGRWGQFAETLAGMDGVIVHGDV